MLYRIVFFSLSFSSGHLVDKPSAFHWRILSELLSSSWNGWLDSMASSKVEVVDGTGAGGDEHLSHFHSCRQQRISISSLVWPDLVRQDLWKGPSQEHTTRGAVLAMVLLDILQLVRTFLVAVRRCSEATFRPVIVNFARVEWVEHIHCSLLYLLIMRPCCFLWQVCLQFLAVH